MGSVNTGLTNWTSRRPLGLCSFHVKSEAFTWGWNLLMYSFFLGFSPRKTNVLLIFICSPATRVPNWLLTVFVMGLLPVAASLAHSGKKRLVAPVEFDSPFSESTEKYGCPCRML